MKLSIQNTENPRCLQHFKLQIEEVHECSSLKMEAAQQEENEKLAC